MLFYFLILWVRLSAVDYNPPRRIFWCKVFILFDLDFDLPGKLFYLKDLLAKYSK